MPAFYKCLLVPCMWMILALSAVQPGFAKETASPGIGMGNPWSVVWTDVNGDGRSDYCYLYGTDGERIRCFMADTEGRYASTPAIDTVIGGTGGSLIWWADIDGDGRTDVCRADRASYFGQTPDYAGTTHTLWCRLAGNGFAGDSVVTHVPDFYDDGEANLHSEGVWDMGEVFFADVNGDQKSDMCFLAHAQPDPNSPVRLRCHLSTGTGFGGPTAAWTSIALNPGNGAYPRSFADANGDGAADFCRTLDDGTLH